MQWCESVGGSVDCWGSQFLCSFRRKSILDRVGTCPHCRLTYKRSKHTGHSSQLVSTPIVTNVTNQRHKDGDPTTAQMSVNRWTTPKTRCSIAWMPYQPAAFLQLFHMLSFYCHPYQWHSQCSQFTIIFVTHILYLTSVRCRKGIPIFSFPMSPSLCCVICSSHGYSSRQLGGEGHGDRVLWWPVLDNGLLTS